MIGVGYGIGIEKSPAVIEGVIPPAGDVRLTEHGTTRKTEHGTGRKSEED